MLSLYLIADLAVGSGRGGVIHIPDMTSTRSDTAASNRMASFHHDSKSTAGDESSARLSRLWMLLFFYSILLLAFSIELQAGPVCEGPFKSSPYCTSTVAALIVSILGMILCVAYGAIRVSQMKTQRSRARRSSSMANSIERILAFGIFIGYACNAGITTSPGGSGSNVGNVYISSWMALIIALVLNVNYLGLHFISKGDNCHHHQHRHQMGHHRMLSKEEELHVIRKNSHGNNEDDYEGIEYEDEDETVMVPQMMYHVDDDVASRADSRVII